MTPTYRDVSHWFPSTFQGVPRCHRKRHSAALGAPFAAGKAPAPPSSASLGLRHLGPRLELNLQRPPTSVSEVSEGMTWWIHGGIPLLDFRWAGELTWPRYPLCRIYRYPGMCLQSISTQDGSFRSTAFHSWSASAPIHLRHAASCWPSSKGGIKSKASRGRKESIRSRMVGSGELDRIVSCCSSGASTLLKTARAGGLEAILGKLAGLEWIPKANTFRSTGP